MKLADLSQAQLDRIMQVESELEVSLVAMEFIANPADLTDEQIERVQSLEDEMDLVLVAHSV